MVFRFRKEGGVTKILRRRWVWKF